MWSSGSSDLPRRTSIPLPRSHSRRSSVERPKTTWSRSVYTDPQGGAAFLAGPTKSRRYSSASDDVAASDSLSAASSSSKRLAPLTISVMGSSASSGVTKGHSPHNAEASDRASATYSASTSSRSSRGSYLKRGPSVLPTRAMPSSVFSSIVWCPVMFAPRFFAWIRTLGASRCRDAWGQGRLRVAPSPCDCYRPMPICTP